MKLFFALLITLSSAFAFAGDLSRYSNQELLNELARRLDGDNAGGEGAFAIANCKAGGYLVLQISTDEQNNKKEVYIGSECNNVLTSMKSKLGRVTRTQRVAFCKAGGYLNSLVLSPKGTFRIDEEYVGSDCKNQADYINSLR